VAAYRRRRRRDCRTMVTLALCGLANALGVIATLPVHACHDDSYWERQRQEQQFDRDRVQKRQREAERDYRDNQRQTERDQWSSEANRFEPPKNETHSYSYSSPQDGQQVCTQNTYTGVSCH
jgi:hypothetical protein